MKIKQNKCRVPSGAQCCLMPSRDAYCPVGPNGAQCLVLTGARCLLLPDSLVPPNPTAAPLVPVAAQYPVICTHWWLQVPADCQWLPVYSMYSGSCCPVSVTWYWFLASDGAHLCPVPTGALQCPPVFSHAWCPQIPLNFTSATIGHFC